MSEWVQSVQSIGHFVTSWVLIPEFDSNYVKCFGTKIPFHIRKLWFQPTGRISHFESCPITYQNNRCTVANFKFWMWVTPQERFLERFHLVHWCHYSGCVHTSHPVWMNDELIRPLGKRHYSFPALTANDSKGTCRECRFFLERWDQRIDETPLSYVWITINWHLKQLV